MAAKALSDIKNQKSRKKKAPWRLIVQILFFGLVVTTVVGHALADEGVEVPIFADVSLHSICPFGGVVTIYQLITAGTMVKKIHESSLVLMGIVLTLAVFLGPVFCGWICPFGSLQEWVGKIGKKLWKRRYNTFVPPMLDKILRYLRYLVLAWVLYMTVQTGLLVFSDFDPYYTLFNLWTGEVAIAGIVILAAVLVLSLFVERPFCKYACPYGAFLGLFNLIKIFPVRRNTHNCLNCKLCDSSCPMNIEVSESGVVRDHQCISCNECSSDNQCPVGDTVAFRVAKWKVPALPVSGADAGKEETA